jgi:DNA-binding transcriptional regulator YdaS (Cro superfamily)
VLRPTQSKSCAGYVARFLVVPIVSWPILAIETIKLLTEYIKGVYDWGMSKIHPLDIPGVRKIIRDQLGITTQAMTNWKAKGETPIEHCVPIEKATNGIANRKTLRPKDWKAIWPELATKTSKEAI